MTTDFGDLIGLILGATAVLSPLCQLLWRLALGQMGAAQHPAVRLPGFPAASVALLGLSHQVGCGWHWVIGSGLSYGTR